MIKNTMHNEFLSQKKGLINFSRTRSSGLEKGSFKKDLNCKSLLSRILQEDNFTDFNGITPDLHQHGYKEYLANYFYHLN